MKCGVLQDIRERERERERDETIRRKVRMEKFNLYSSFNTDMQNTQGQRENAQTYITRQSIGMCTYM